MDLKTLEVEVAMSSENADLWMDEVERRLREIEMGTAEMISSDDVFRKARALLTPN